MDGTRRGFLVAGATLLAGCSALPQPPATARVGCIDLVNGDEQPHTVHLQIERNGEVLHWSSTALDPRGASDEGGRTDERLVVPEWPEDTQSFTIRARLDDRDDWRERSASDYAGDVGVVVRATADGLVFLQTDEAGYCGADAVALNGREPTATVSEDATTTAEPDDEPSIIVAGNRTSDGAATNTTNTSAPNGTTSTPSDERDA